jgi:hypothetical protein
MIRRLVTEKGITRLCHFTKFENLGNILQNGLVPRNDLVENDINFLYNDMYRIDGYPNASCLSITFPNYKMFYRYRCNTPNQDWVVIEFKPEVLWEKDCAFCISNAACNSVTAIPIDQRKTGQAFSGMFENIHDMAPRETTLIPPNCSTNPQAEVLVFSTIEPTYIMNVNLKSTIQRTNVERIRNLDAQFPAIPFYSDEELFSYRSDYAHWK